MKIAVAAGHTKVIGKAGYGAVGIFHESYETRRVASELLLLLRRKGHTAINCTVDSASSTNDYLKKQCKLVNNSGADLFICIHFNAFNTQANGTEVYTWKGKKTKTASSICENISKLGFKNRGVKDGSGLYVIKHTKMDAILIEVAFIDNVDDMHQYDEVGASGIAKAIYYGVFNS